MLQKGINDAGKIVRTANEDTTSRRAKSQGIEPIRKPHRMLREKSTRGGEAGLRNEQNTELTLKRVPIDLNPLPKT
jgi:hypothetical protein